MRIFWGQAQGLVAVAPTLALQRFAATDQAYQIQLFFTRFLFARAAFSPPPAHYSASCGPEGTKCGHFGDKHRARWLWQQPLRSRVLLPQTRRIRLYCFWISFPFFFRATFSFVVSPPPVAPSAQMDISMKCTRVSGTRWQSSLAIRFLQWSSWQSDYFPQSQVDT